MIVSIIIPAYNETDTILELLKRVQRVDLSHLGVNKEIIVVNDASTDQTKEKLQSITDSNFKIIHHEQNQGKGSAIRTGLKHTTGTYILIQDADLEYDPNDYSKLLKPLINNETKVVYGSRVRHKDNRYHSGYHYYLGGKFLTFLTNLLYGSSLTDEATCYKVFHKDIIKQIPLTCKRFEFCPEITAKILKRKIPIHEVPIRYTPRKTHEGKKIRGKDGLQAIWILFKHKLFNE